MRKVRRKYGSEGYAIYWFCLEAIAYDVDKDNLTFDLKEDAETIGFELDIQERRVEEIMKYMIEVGLFESSNNVITCLKLADQMDKSMTNSPKMRAWLGKRKDENVMTSGDTVMTSGDENMTCHELEEKRTEQNKNKDQEICETKVSTPAKIKTKVVKRFAKPSVDQVHSYMAEKGTDNFNEAEKFHNYFESKGWTVGKSKMKCWKAAVRNWLKNDFGAKANSSGPMGIDINKSSHRTGSF